MLTKGDDYPLHQTPEPIAYAGTDRNFYDRYFFNGYNPDGSDFFALAFGVYPHLNIADAHFSALRGTTQHCLHASRVLHMERMDLRVGPIRIEIVEPLRRLRLHVEGEGVAAELLFEGRAFPVEEPRFTHRIGPRSFMDYTRLTQNGRWTGWIEVDGERRVLSPDAVGTRDRSWGVRPIGAADPQPLAPPVRPSFFWLWSPLNFRGFSVFFHVNADNHGRPWNTRAVLCPDVPHRRTCCIANIRAWRFAGLRDRATPNMPCCTRIFPVARSRWRSIRSPNSRCAELVTSAHHGRTARIRANWP
ncbi:MAG: hypothetical protein WDN04_05615 [Rhodospirillales bacterium]